MIMYVQVCDAGLEEAELAVSSAHSVQKTWAGLPAKVHCYHVV